MDKNELVGRGPKAKAVPQAKQFGRTAATCQSVNMINKLYFMLIGPSNAALTKGKHS